MDDRRAPLEDRLADWFAAETRRAEHDLRDGLRPRRSRAVARRRRAAALVVVGVAVVAVGTAGLRLVAGPAGVASVPSGSAGAVPSSAPPTLSPRASASSGVRLGPDGLPAAIDGEAVARLDELQAALRAGETAAVAGWVDQPLYACAEPEWPLLPTCTARRLSPTEPQGRSGGGSIDLVAGEVGVPFGPVAVRVHTGDPAAESCPPDLRARCSAAIVVDEVLWRDEAMPAITGLSPDGIPNDIDGDPVLRPGDVTPAAGAGPWLVGGWHSDGRLSDAPGADGIALLDAGEVAPGPAVLRARAAGAASASCPPDGSDDCRPAVAIEDVVWTRDATPAPLEESAITQALGEATQPDGRPVALAPAPPGKESCDPGWPAVLWEAEAGGTVGLVAVYASSAEADEVDGRLGAAGWQGLGCTVTFDSSVTWQWVRVENVVVQMNLTLPDGTAAELALVERVRAGLEVAATR